MTRDDAIKAHYRQTFYHVSLRNADGTAVRCRVNGRCKTWKTRPTEFRLPVKFGLKECFTIELHNAEKWMITDPTEEPTDPTEEHWVAGILIGKNGKAICPGVVCRCHEPESRCPMHGT